MKILKKQKNSEKLVKDEDEQHLGCYSYPDCDLNPLGCILSTDEPEEFGWRD